MRTSVAVWVGVVAVALAAGWVFRSAGTGGQAAQPLDEALTAHAAIPVKALEVIEGKKHPSLALPDAQGRLWLVQDYGIDTVSMREPDGRWVTVVGAGGSGPGGDGGLAHDAQLSSPDSIAFAPDGTLYVADTGNLVIRAVDPVTGKIRRVAGNGRGGAEEGALNAPKSLLRTPDGALWFVAQSHRADKVYRLVPETGQVDLAYDSVEATPQWGGNPSAAYIGDLAADAQGRIYIADNGNMRLLRLDAWGGPPANPRAPPATVLAGNGTMDLLKTDVPATQSPLGLIGSMALGPDGTVYLFEGPHLVRLDTRSNRLVTVLPDGAWVLPAGRQAQPLELRQPRLRVGADGALYIANYLLDQVLVLKL